MRHVFDPSPGRRHSSSDFLVRATFPRLAGRPGSAGHGAGSGPAGLTTTSLGGTAAEPPTKGTGLQKRDSEAFDAFVRARLPDLLGSAARSPAATGPADLVQDALERTLVRWSRADGDPEGYTRRMMATRNVPAWRRLRGERSTTQVP